MLNRTNTARAESDTPVAPERATPRAVQVRLEGAPWLSLRDRCGVAQGAARRQSPAPWRSLSRIEVAMAVVLLVLVAAVFQGVQSQPRLALAHPDTPSVAPVTPVSVIE